MVLLLKSIRWRNHMKKTMLAFLFAWAILIAATPVRAQGTDLETSVLDDH